MANKKASADTVRTGIEEITTQGDLLYRGETDLKHLSKGSSGQQLSMGNSNEPEWISVADELPAAGTSGNLLTSTGSAWASSTPAAGGGATPVLYVYSGANNSYPNGTDTKISFNLEVLDSQSAWDTSTFRFTPSVGSYLFICHIKWATWGATCSQYLFLKKNGTSVVQATSNQHGSGGAGMNFVSVQDANGTDYFEFFAHQQTGGTIGLQADRNGTYAHALKVS